MSLRQATTLQVMQPRLPSAAQLLPYLDRIDQSRIYSNFGPLYHELSGRLAEYFGVAADQVALVANGTLALQAGVETVGEIADTWIVPSWTFVASGQAVLAARRRIHFVDVDESTWAMKPERRPYARGALVVAPFGSMPEVGAWQGIPGPKIFDAASCFDACRGIGPLLDDASLLMVSLHATKTLPAGEGAVLVGPSDWVRRASQWANFGFAGSRFASGPGMNAKMSEYHAAVGLASLDEWPLLRPHWAEAMVKAMAVSASNGLEVQPAFRAGWITSTWNVLLPENCAVGEVVDRLRAGGVESRSWWPSGVSDMPAFTTETTDALAVTDRLVGGVLGLPFGPHLTAAHFDLVGACLAEILSSSVRQL